MEPRIERVQSELTGMKWWAVRHRGGISIFADKAIALEAVRLGESWLDHLCCANPDNFRTIQEVR